MQAGTGRFRTRRRWGQHFLVNPGAIDTIIGAFGPGPDDLVLEVGPGAGALTRRLAGRVRRLVAVEVDPDLAAALRAEFQDAHPGAPVAVVESDILRVDLNGLLAGLGATAARRVRVIANLPYNIATAVILRLLERRVVLGDLLLMVQREVAARLLSPPGRKTYGGLTVLCQAQARVETVLRLRPGSFRPRPKVDSEVIRITPRDAAETGDLSGLAELLRLAFERRRKTLLNNLARLPAAGPSGSPPSRGPAAALGHDAAEALIRGAGLDPGCRPEQVPPSGYLRLLKSWRQSPG
jgi:16S rRNA (adenine1518-N6/adenine1519-N6)-dimethyltransferase